MAKKKKSPLNKRRILRDPAFEGTRQTMSEFGRAGKANRLLRSAFKLALRNKTDRHVSARLTKTMLNVIHSDPVSKRGERRIIKGELAILEGFNFNRYTSLQNTLRAPYSITLDRTAGQVIVTFPSFMAKSMVETPSDAAAFVLTGIAAALNMEDETTTRFSPIQTDILDLSNHPRETISLQLPLQEHNPTLPVIVALGIELYRQKRGQYEPIDKKYNALAVVKAFPAIIAPH